MAAATANLGTALLLRSRELRRAEERIARQASDGGKRRLWSMGSLAAAAAARLQRLAGQRAPSEAAFHEGLAAYVRALDVDASERHALNGLGLAFGLWLHSAQQYRHTPENVAAVGKKLRDAGHVAAGRRLRAQASAMRSARTSTNFSGAARVLPG